MAILFRTAIFFLAIVSSYIGSLKFQSSDSSDMVIGSGLLIISIIALFFFTRKLWRFLGCFSSLILIVVLVGGLFMLVSGGSLFNKAMTAVTGKKPAQQQNQQMPAPAMPQPQHAVSQQAAPLPQDQQFIPVRRQPPAITGNVSKILGGDTIQLQGMNIRLYGIASPVLAQTCTDSHNRGYDCGYVSARKLQEFIGSDPVTCKVMSQNNRGDLMAACSVSSIDIGAAMVEAGWAIALPQITPIYVPYETKARQSNAGLWEGQFQNPWEWQAQQQQSVERASKIKPPKINLPKPKNARKSIFDSF